MTKIAVDLGELAEALQGSEMIEYFVDRETGEVIGLPEGGFGDEHVEILRGEIDDDESGRYLRVEPLPSRDGFRMMQDFAGSLPEGGVRAALFDAMTGARPFRRFGDAVERSSVRDEWLAFRDGRYREHAAAWLAEHGISAGPAEYRSTTR